MNPSTPPATPPQNSPYDFILSPDQAPKRSPINTSSTPMRIMVVVIGLFVLLLVVVLFMKLLGASGGLNKSALLSVGQDQTEIIRLADSGSNDAVSQSAKNFAINAKLSVASQQSTLLTYLADKHFKPKDKVLALKQSATTDTQLASAKSSSTYDVAYRGVMKDLLIGYQKDLNTAYGDADSAGQAVLKSDFNGAQLLLTQLASF